MNGTVDDQSSNYCVPVGLTILQKDLIEILISIHARSLLQFYNNEDVYKFEESKGFTKLTLPALSPQQLTSMLAANIRAIANHPFLLVEHYMPRQLLLMEPGERLIGASDKFQKMALLLDSLFSRDRTKFPKALQITILSHSVKELDLIEGYLLGKPVKLRRLSGTSLFDEKHCYGESETRSSTPVLPTGYIKDEYEYGKRRAVPALKDESDWVFLATATHLARSPTLMDEFCVDIVIGFDPLIDAGLECFQRMRRTGKKVPLIKLMVEDSPDHYVLAHSNMKSEDDHFLDSLLHFIKHRHTITSDDALEWPGQLIEDILQGVSSNPTSLPPCHLAKETTNVNLFDCLTTYRGLSHMKTMNFELKPVNQDLDMKVYQGIVMELIVRRLTACEKGYSVHQKEVLGQRLRETMRQDEFDQIKDEAATTFKRTKEEETSFNESVKKLNKAQSDQQKLSERLKVLSDRKYSFETILNDIKVPAVQITHLTEELAKLRSELASEMSKNSQKATLNDELRVLYQAESSRAASQSLVLKTLREKRDELKARLESPATNLHSIGTLEEESRLRKELVRVVQQSQFIQGYIKRVQKQYSLNGVQGSKKVSSNAARTRRGRNTTLE
ncbi:LANO_0H10682g1_1 [Lachancea nothofagi CBS 11611]|uniref:LANO_0H10682g1_1 n=1 Tax=Lachancea nothofagi CBS 11611 TaxID=1266666 RepID=A0A1G4KLZ0_9SACH|nr:LANO_0H10682g1_1 [Lachancea nothofagi CBS 11611]